MLGSAAKKKKKRKQKGNTASAVLPTLAHLKSNRKTFPLCSGVVTRWEVRDSGRAAKVHREVEVALTIRCCLCKRDHNFPTRFQQFAILDHAEFIRRHIHANVAQVAKISNHCWNKLELAGYLISNVMYQSFSV